MRPLSDEIAYVPSAPSTPDASLQNDCARWMAWHEPPLSAEQALECSGATFGGTPARCVRLALRTRRRFSMMGNPAWIAIASARRWTASKETRRRWPAAVAPRCRPLRRALRLVNDFFQVASLLAPQGTVAERPQRPHRQDHHALNTGPCGRLLSLTARVHCPAAVSEVSQEVSSTSKLMLPSLVPASSFIASASSELREYR